MPDLTLNKLSDARCRAAPAGRHGDGGGLYLNVKPSGARNWLFVFRWRGGRPSLGLGGYPAVSLSEARRRAGQCRAWLTASPAEDPRLEWKRLQQPEAIETFGPFALRHIEAIKGDFRNAKHTEQWRTTLKRYAKPIWDLPLHEIGTDEVLRCLEPIWSEKNETARRVRGRIEAVLESARVRGLRDDPNPAAWQGQLKHVLGRRRPAVKHFAALEYERLPEFWARLALKDGMGALALRFLILTAARSGEVRLASWSEIDFERSLWVLSATRMKAERKHVVPLSGLAQSVLAPLQEARTGALVFPGVRRGHPLSDMTLTKALHDMDLRTRTNTPVTVHGFRSSFSDWARNETRFPRELIEESLAHSLGKVEAAYRREAATEWRRELMEAWANFIAGG